MTGFPADSPLVDEICASPNFNDRRMAGGPSMLILHYTGMGTGEGAVRWLADPASEVSCHYVVHEDGRVVQMVPEQHRAWHAGQGSWQGVCDINSLSVGIEIVNAGHAGGYPDFPEGQITKVMRLSAEIVARHRIAPERVLGHSDVAPARKQDPGEKFPWERLAAAGIGHFVSSAPMEAGPCLSPGDGGDAVLRWQRDLASYGYELSPTGDFDEATRFATIAFQRHFRPACVDGVADLSTVRTLKRLRQALVDRGARSLVS
ncbi:peptidoglycan recognition protein family protein [Jiella marina]|uniref:peptidoglycan recognition protein family protein n=1 Tax=Jiella sp. LLJ827 TaxID=2917712 RepID=UPI002100BB4E|nr:N-acetylmuramoyl-L-alanine amidase [Jiella sp. LLJ827]MCQ0989992.1 N-acetylmuramoyl-L-alanine amidase [Jiella sp. LLJ827]